MSAQSPAAAYEIVFVGEALLFLVAAVLATVLPRATRPRAAPSPRVPKLRSARERDEGAIHDSVEEIFDVVVVGGGPCGATAADDLARRGRKVLLLDRGGRIKPCGGAIPPRLIRDFAIPDHLLKARVNSARMISPKAQCVDMPINGGFVGMVDREDFDEFLRQRAAQSGAMRDIGQYQKITRDADGVAVVHYRSKRRRR